MYSKDAGTLNKEVLIVRTEQEQSESYSETCDCKDNHNISARNEVPGILPPSASTTVTVASFTRAALRLPNQAYGAGISASVNTVLGSTAWAVTMAVAADVCLAPCFVGFITTVTSTGTYP